MLGRRLGGLQQLEFSFPIAQDVRLDADDLADLAYLEIDFLRQSGGHARAYSDASEVGEEAALLEDMLLRLFFMI
jgi:hypothetical protein